MEKVINDFLIVNADLEEMRRVELNMMQKMAKQIVTARIKMAIVVIVILTISLVATVSILNGL